MFDSCSMWSRLGELQNWKIRVASWKDESVWWSYLMKIQIVFMDHILFNSSEGEKNPEGRFSSSLSLKGMRRKTIKLWMRYLDLHEFNLSSNCFMKLSCLWDDFPFKKVQWTLRKSIQSFQANPFVFSSMMRSIIPKILS